MKNKIPTAEELCRIEYEDNRPENIFMERSVDMKWAIFMMKHFAKLHVEAALKEKVIAMKKQREEDSSYDMNELDAFTYDAYPLNLIK